MADELMSERATAIHAGVSLTTLQKARKRGTVSPVREFHTGLGTIRLYDARQIKEHFANDQDYQKNYALMRARGIFKRSRHRATLRAEQAQ